MKNTDASKPSSNLNYFLERGGEMGGLMRAYDWTTTPLGDSAAWPQSLKTCISILLNSKFPMFLFWGKGLTCFYNDAFRPSLGAEGKHPAIGKTGPEVWPEIWNFIGPLIEGVLTSGEAIWFEDQLVPFYRNGRMEDIYWTFSYSPVADENGQNTGLFVTCTETTGKVVALKQTAESEMNLRLVIQQAQVAIGIFRGSEYMVEVANKLALDLWGRSEQEVLNRPILKVMSELETQGIKELLDNVYKTGQPFNATELPVQLLRNGKLETFYINFIYEALYDADGNVNGLITIGVDVTDLVESRRQVQELNQELIATNEELSAANEELNAANEELNESEKSLKVLYDGLMESENLFRSLVRQAPVGICIIKADDLFVLEVNDSYLELVGRKREEMENRGIWQAIPEVAEAYRPVMNEVINTGIPFTGKEQELHLLRSGTVERVYVDFVYEPIKLYNHTVDAVMVLAIDVTEKVNTRQRAEEMEERIRLAVEAAETGTFDLDLVNRVMLTSSRFDNIFGFDHHVSWQSVIEAIHPEDQAARAAAHEKGYQTGKLFYEVRVVYPDSSIHWVRIKGQVYYTGDKTPERILGTAIDITEFKRLQQQKDDFLSIASHELKTPITSLKASLQLLDRMKNNPSSEMLPRLIAQSTKSMQKISALVEDLLNVGRASESQLPLNKTKFTIAEMLEACCNHVRVEGKYTLTVRGDTQLQVYADEHAIDQVMVNLVNNAVKYAPDSLEIFITISREGNMAKIEIKDTGPGIATDKLPQLFERYYQANASGYQRSGMGLGLYISSEIVKRHGGQIGVESELGKGSAFWIKLPID